MFSRCLSLGSGGREEDANAVVRVLAARLPEAIHRRAYRRRFPFGEEDSTEIRSINPMADQPISLLTQK